MKLLREKARLENAVKEAIEKERQDQLIADMLEIEREELSVRSQLEQEMLGLSLGEAREIREARRNFFNEVRMFQRAKEQEQIQLMKREKEGRAHIQNEDYERKNPMLKELKELYKKGHEQNRILHERERQRQEDEDRARRRAAELEAKRKQQEEEELKKWHADMESLIRREAQAYSRLMQELQIDEMDLDREKKKGEAVANALYVRRCREQERLSFGRKGLRIKVEGLEKSRLVASDSVGSLTVVEPKSLSAPHELTVSVAADLPPCFDNNFRLEKDEMSIEAWRRQKKQIMKVVLTFSLEEGKYQKGADRLILDTENFVVIPSSYNTSRSSSITTPLLPNGSISNANIKFGE